MNRHYAGYGSATLETANAVGLSPARLALWSKMLMGLMRASKAGDDQSAALLFRSIGDAIGPKAQISSLIYLADRAALPWRSEGSGWPREVVGIEVIDGMGRLADLDSLPYTVRWSARMVAASANGDYDALDALIGAAADDCQVSACVPVLAQMAAAVPAPLAEMHP